MRGKPIKTRLLLFAFLFSLSVISMHALADPSNPFSLSPIMSFTPRYITDEEFDGEVNVKLHLTEMLFIP